MTQNLVAGVYTVSDEEMMAAVRRLWSATANGTFVEPSCGAALLGLDRLRKAAEDGSQPEKARQLARWLLEQGTHVFWMTGGALVPDSERAAVLHAL